MRPSFYPLLLSLSFLGNLHALPQEGLLALWDFESGASNSATGDTALPDGSLQGNATTTDASAPIMGTYLQLDGDGDFMDVGDHPFYQNLDSSWSAGAWFRAERAPTGDERFFVFETSGGRPISLGLQEGNAGFTNAQVFADIVGAAPDPSLDIQIPNDEITDWNHVLITSANVDGTRTLTAYLNGAAVGSISPTAPFVASSDGFHIGTDREAAGLWFPGSIDEIALWNRALTPLEAGFFQEPVTVTTLADEDDGNLEPSNGAGTSLREAINHASENAYIQFAPSLNGGTLNLTQGQLVISTSLTIDASSLSRGFTIDANGRVNDHRVMEIQDNSSVALHGLTLDDGQANAASFPDNAGGAIFLESVGSGNSVQLSLFSCTVSNSSASSLGGAIFSGATSGGSSSLNLDDCTILLNFAGFQGGGIFSDSFNGNSASVSVTNSTFTGNAAVDDGGGLFSSTNTNVDLNACSFIDNFASRGGGIFGTANQNITMNGCTLSENTAIGDGGGFFSFNNTNTQLNNCTITANSATLNGGGVYSTNLSGNLSMTLSHCTIFENSADIRGGGVFNETTLAATFNLILSNSIIAQNTAPSAFDLGDAGTSVSITATGSNLVSDLRGQTALPAGTLGVTVITEPFLLAPLSNYGGPTMTLPPMPGSPALNAGGSTDPDGVDQRGFPRFANGALDIGAVEIQTGEVINGINPFPFPIADFSEDSDQDGTSNGVEFILGTDPLTPDAGDARNPAISFNQSGALILRFGRNTDLPAGITLNVVRSTTLQEDSFAVISTYLSTDDSTTLGLVLTNTEFFFTDTSIPSPKAFYRLEATFEPSGF